MNIELINEPNKNYLALEQILINRGLSENQIYDYLNLSSEVVSSPIMLNEEDLKQGLTVLLKNIKNNKKIIIIVDCDCDGYTSSALLVNYLYKIFPTYVENYIDYYFHNSKQHGLSDCYEYIISKGYNLVICPDSSSNDYKYHKQLKEHSIDVLVLDHHLAKQKSQDAIIINNQLSGYPNKSLSGVGVVWQFCRYIDMYLNKNIANDFLDLVALGLIGDMMSLKSFETKYLINQGLSKKSIKNPFIEYMIDKNSFPLNKTSYKSFNEGQEITAIGAAFFIVPFVNAVTRCGTKEEKSLLFNSMLNHKAFTNIPSNKKGHKPDEKELLVLQAVRTIGNVKNRQTKAEKAGVELLEKRIKENNMDNDYLLLFLVELHEIAPEIRGLIANKFAAKYQRPCAVLTKTINSENGEISYEGSMRGYTKNGVKSFKKLCEQCPGTIYVEGHDNAAGLGIAADKIEDFIATANTLIQKESSSEITHQIDYYFTESNIDEQIILDIAKLNDLWGQDIERAYIGIKFKVTSDNFQIMKSNTLKFNLENNISIIKFNGTENDINNFTTDGWKEIEAYCECAINEWNGKQYPQLILCDYNIIKSSNFFF
ncbi:MAG: DHH family phosphoesterase [Candidatus Onthovivens sp.]|nr:DHH family phosphoesterase [Candidatus Onthovivens sp.]